MMKALRSFILVISVFVLTGVADPCRTQVVFSPNGVAKATEAGAKYYLASHKDWIQNAVNSSFDSMRPTRAPMKMSKAAINMGTTGTIDGAFSMSEMHISDSKTGDPEITCTGRRCKVKLPVQSLKFTSNFQFVCDDSAGCVPNPKLDIHHVGMSFDMKDFPGKETPSIEYDVEFNPADRLNGFFRVLPETGKINLPYEVVSQAHVGLDMTDADKADADQRFQKQIDLYNARDKILASCPGDRSQFPSDQAIVLAQNWEEAGKIAIREKYRDYLKTPESVFYYSLIKDATDENRSSAENPTNANTRASPLGGEQMKKIWDAFLEKKLAPLIGVGLNHAIENGKIFNQNMALSVPVETVGDAIDQAKPKNVDSDSRVPAPVPSPKRKYALEVVGAGVDEDENVVLDLSGCPHTDKMSTNHSVGGIEPIQSRKPGLNPPPDFDMAFSVDLPTLNSYLREAFADPERDRIHTRPMSETSFMRKIDIDPEIKVMFKEPPQFYTKIEEVPILDEQGKRVKNPATGKYMTKTIARPVLKFVLYEHAYSTLLTKYVHIFDKKITGEGQLVLKNDLNNSGEKVVNFEVDPNEFSRQPQWRKFDKALGGVISKVLPTSIAKDMLVQKQYPKALKDKINVSPEDSLGFQPLQLEASPDGNSINGAGKFYHLYDNIVKHAGTPSDSEDSP